jgi:alcohol dehydrogenase class IV
MSTAVAARSDLDVLFDADEPANVVLPRRLVVGDGCLARVGETLAESGSASGSFLVIVDRAVAGLGAGEAAAASIREVGAEPSLYTEIDGEPDLAAVERAVTAVRAAPYAAVVGVGGGSALDTAKLAAALATNSGPVAGFVHGTHKFTAPPLPLALVPTTGGTGAEASKNAIVTDEDQKVVVSSPLLMPTVALLDPVLTVSCPPAVTIASGLDALAHAVEAALSSWATPFTTMHALSAIRLIVRWLPVAAARGSDLPARRAMLYASHLAGLSLNASTLLGHTLAYGIARITHLPHGVTTAMALPYCVAYNAAAAPHQMRLIADAAGADAASLAGQLQELIVGLGVPASLGAVGIAERDLPALVEHCVVRYPRPNNPRPFDREGLLALAHSFHAGDVDGAQR